MIRHYWDDARFGEKWFNYKDIYNIIIECAPENGRIVEIGAWKGASTSYLAVEAQHKKLRIDVIDTWAGSHEHKGTSDIIEDSLFETFIDNLRPIIKYINPIRADSVTASRMYDEESLDAVFIDADHEYESVKKDILAWMPKVKKGGILAGHDYSTAHGGVIRAVSELIDSPKIIKDCWLKVK
jgi:hypothetical protein